MLGTAALKSWLRGGGDEAGKGGNLVERSHGLCAPTFGLGPEENGE